MANNDDEHCGDGLREDPRAHGRLVEVLVLLIRDELQDALAKLPDVKPKTRFCSQEFSDPILVL